MKRLRKVPAPEESLSMSINGHTLSGSKRGGRWTFICLSRPDLTKKYEGSKSSCEMLGEFTDWAIGKAIEIVQDEGGGS